MLFRSSSKEPKSANKLLRQGYDHFVAGKSLRALIIFRKVAKINPKNQTAHYYCGCAFEQIGYPGFATPHYKKVAKLALQSDGRNSANYAQAIHNLGVNAAWLHQQKLAIEYALEAVEIARNISLAKDGISDKKWHKEVALAGKNLAPFEAYTRYFYFNEAIDIAKKCQTLKQCPVTQELYCVV